MLIVESCGVERISPGGWCLFGLFIVKHLALLATKGIFRGRLLGNDRFGVILVLSGNLFVSIQICSSNGRSKSVIWRRFTHSSIVLVGSGAWLTDILLFLVIVMIQR